MYEIYASLRDSRNMKDYQVAKTIGISPATLSDWKNGKNMPKTDKMVLIANLFNVSLDYLVTGSETPTETFSDDERKLLCLFRKLSSTGKIEAIGRIEEMATSEKWTKKKTDIQAG